MSEGRTLHIERTYQAPAEAVFEAWTSEEVLRRWWRVEHEWETTEAEVDVRIGGAVRVVMRDPGKDAEYGGGGTYTEIEPPTVSPSPGRGTATRRQTLIEIDFIEERRRHHASASPTAASGTSRPCANTRTAGARSSPGSI